MEVDSVHSTIENACRNQDVYTPTDYYKVIAMVRRHLLQSHQIVVQTLKARVKVKINPQD